MVATELNNLAVLLRGTNRMAEAEPLDRRALAIDERTYGLGHPDVARDLGNLAELLHGTNRMAEAELLYRRALATDERAYGPRHPDVASRLNNLALLLRYTNRMAEAEPLYRQALAIYERSYGSGHPDVAIALYNLADLLHATNRVTQAEPLTARAVCVFSRFQQSTGHEHPNFQATTTLYRQLLTLRKLSEPEIAASDQIGNRGDRQAISLRPRGGPTTGPGQTGCGRAVVPGSPIQGAEQASHLFPRAKRTNRSASRRAAPADFGRTDYAGSRRIPRGTSRRRRRALRGRA